MGQSGVKALPSPRSFKPFWSSDGKINTTRGKRGLELPPIRQGISSGASAVSNDGLQNHWRNFKIQTSLLLSNLDFGRSAYAPSAKEFSSGDNFRCALRTIAFEGWGLCSVVFWSMSSLRLHQLDTAINSYRVCRVERQIAIVSSIVQSQRFRKFGLH